MTKTQWHNLYHSARYYRRFCGTIEAIALLDYYSEFDKQVIMSVWGVQ
jgi:hypothetical protein